MVENQELPTPFTLLSCVLNTLGKRCKYTTMTCRANYVWHSYCSRFYLHVNSIYCIYATKPPLYTWWFHIHSPTFLHYKTMLQKMCRVDHCLYDRMVGSSLHVHCMQNQSPTLQYQVPEIIIIISLFIVSVIFRYSFVDCIVRLPRVLQNCGSRWTTEHRSSIHSRHNKHGGYY